MRSTFLLMLMLLAACGCKQNGSAFPLVEEENQHFDDRLVGTWDTADETARKADSPEPLKITRFAAGGYVATLHDRKGKPLTFDIRLVEAGSDRFFQARRQMESGAAMPGLAMSGLGMHHFYCFGRYTLVGEELQVQFCWTEELRKKLKADDFPFVETEDTLLLTGTSEQLLRFLREHADELFPPSQPLIKIDPSPAKETTNGPDRGR